MINWRWESDGRWDAESSGQSETARTGGNVHKVYETVPK